MHRGGALSREEITDSKTAPTAIKMPRYSPDLPIGGFVFDTALYGSPSACTSNPNAWRCLSSKESRLPRFYWNHHRGGFRITKSLPPTTPLFRRLRNIPLVVLDERKKNERFVFSFKFNTTVGLAVTSTNRAAKCTCTDAIFQATRWTKRGI